MVPVTAACATQVGRGLAFGAICSLLCCAPPEAVPPVSPQADGVDVRLSQPPPGARLVGTLEVVHGHGCGQFGNAGTIEGALATIKTEAATRGANYVYITGRFPPHPAPACFDQRYRMTGIAYVVSDGYPPDAAESLGDAGVAQVRAQ